MNHKTPVLVLFDLVSTITDAGPRYAEAYVRMSEQYGLGTPDSAAILCDLGNKNLREIIACHSPGLGTGKLSAFMNDCNNACDSLLYDVHWVERLFGDVRETLQVLKAQGYTLGLYTGTREDAMQAQLRYHNILHSFDSALLRGKDNERDALTSTLALKIAQMKSMIAEFRSRDNASSAQVIVVGDSMSDYHAARENGAVFVGFAENWQKSLDMKEAGIGTHFSDYKDLPDILRILSAGFVPGNTLRHGFKPAA